MIVRILVGSRGLRSRAFTTALRAVMARPATAPRPGPSYMSCKVWFEGGASWNVAYCR